jgi:hypothetical protein
MKGYKPPSRLWEWFSRHGVLMLSKYDPEWDHFVRMAITLGMVKVGYYSPQPDPTWLSECHVKIGDYEVWVGNYPYVYGVPSSGNIPDPTLEISRVRPSYATIKLLKKHVDQLIHEAKGQNKC